MSNGFRRAVHVSRRLEEMGLMSVGEALDELERLRKPASTTTVRLSPTQMERLKAAGFTPGEENLGGWMVRAIVEGTKP